MVAKKKKVTAPVRWQYRVVYRPSQDDMDKMIMDGWDLFTTGEALGRFTYRKPKSV